MQLNEAIERLETVVATTGSPDADTTDIGRALSASSQLKSFLASQDAELAKMLCAVPGSYPEATIAEATRCSLNDAARDTDRATTLGHADAMADALASGDIATGHVDALTRAGRQLDDEQRVELLDQHEQLAAEATDMTPGDFDKLLKKKVKDLQRESGTDRLDRQRRNTSLSIWADPDDMVCLKGRFDPVTGSEIKARLRDVVASIRAAGIPDTAPSDSLGQQRHLDAVGLAHLVLRDDSSSARSNSAGVAPIALPTTSRRDALVVVDATDVNSSGTPSIDHGLPVEIPFAVLRDLFSIDSPDTVIVANGIVLHAPGNLDLGRSTRLANRAQRRALRGLYSTCAIPGCNVHYDNCKLHHVIWWRHGGRTDLSNLLPVCQHHHTRLHDNNWIVELGPNRELTITLPDGHVLRSGPPRRSAA